MFRSLSLSMFMVCVACDQASKDVPGAQLAGARVTAPETAPKPLPELSAAAPLDRPVTTTGQDEGSALAKAVAPYRAEAKRTYPAAKSRFLAGLPSGHHFFVTVSLREGPKHETVFNEIATLAGYKSGDPVQFSEQEVEDWTISRPDGSEEGNVVGKFLDTWHQTHP
jgi:hypothetical protein